MNAGGKYQHLVTIEQNTPTIDGNGQEIPSWASIGQRWMSREFVGADQTTTHRQQQAEYDAVFKTWSDSLTTTITPAHRLSSGGLIFSIRSVHDVLGNGKEIIIEASGRKDLGS